MLTAASYPSATAQQPRTSVFAFAPALSSSNDWFGRSCAIDAKHLIVSASCSTVFDYCLNTATYSSISAPCAPSRGCSRIALWIAATADGAVIDTTDCGSRPTSAAPHKTASGKVTVNVIVASAMTFGSSSTSECCQSGFLGRSCCRRA